MFPYTGRFKWWIRGRQAHLADAIEAQPGMFKGKRGKRLERRVKGLRRWLKVRIVMLVLLSFSLIATIASTILSFIPATADLEAALRMATRIASTFAGAFTLLYLFAIRTLGQLEIDALMLLHLQDRDLHLA